MIITHISEEKKKDIFLLCIHLCSMCNYFPGQAPVLHTHPGTAAGIAPCNLFQKLCFAE